MKNLENILDANKILNNMSSGVIISKYDDDFTIIYANCSLYKLLGYSKEEIENEFGNSYEPLVLPEDKITADASMEEQLKTSNKYTLKYRVRRKDGEIIWVLENGLYLKTDDDEEYVQYILTDITEQKVIETELRIAQRKFEIAIGYSDVTTFEYNVLTKKIMTNEEDFEVFGIPKFVENSLSELINSGIIAERSKSAFKEMYDEIDQGVPKVQRIIFAIDIDGNERIIEISLTNIFDENGNPVSAVGVRKDITQMSMLERENEYNKILASQKIFICEANLNKNTILQHNADWAPNINVENGNDFEENMKTFAKEYIHEEDIKTFIDVYNRESLADKFWQGERLITIEYRKRSEDSEFKWFRNSINIIKDRLSEDIKIKCFSEDVTEAKHEENRLKEEKQLFESLIKNAKVQYTVNVTKNKVISGHENWNELYGITISDNYNEMIKVFAKNAIYIEDREKFYEKFNINNIAKEYASGIVNLSCEYRRLDCAGMYIWYRCAFHVFEDENTGELRGNAYIENINNEKERELELIYNAEHDMLTGFYNKVSIEKYIKMFLNEDEGVRGNHALFTLDFDYFKDINDTFGHVYGDVVLSKTSEKIRRLFRDIDIIGRIGGDEFIVFLKNIKNERIAVTKAEEICKACERVFMQNNIPHKFSVSVGIAFYKAHGVTYDELYLHSDAALYISKQNGRNCVTVYSDNMVIQNSNINDVYENELLAPRDFKENIAEYVFRILYVSKDKNVAINAVLDLIGKHFDVSRVYVFENSLFHGYTSNTFEWCNDNIKPQMEGLQNVSEEVMGNPEEKFDENGIYFISDVNKLEGQTKERLKVQNIKSVLKCSIVISGEYKGFVGFDECRAIRIPSKKQVSDMKNVANILGVFIMEMRSSQEKDATKNITMAIVNGLESCTHITDPETFRMLFVNKNIHDSLPKANVGALCYEIFRNKSVPCENCPMIDIYKSGKERATAVMEGSNFAPWLRVAASWIDWIDGSKKCLIECTDITEYKSQR